MVEYFFGSIFPFRSTGLTVFVGKIKGQSENNVRWRYETTKSTMGGALHQTSRSEHVPDL